MIYLSPLWKMTFWMFEQKQELIWAWNKSYVFVKNDWLQKESFDSEIRRSVTHLHDHEFERSVNWSSQISKF